MKSTHIVNCLTKATKSRLHSHSPRFVHGGAERIFSSLEPQRMLVGPNGLFEAVEPFVSLSWGHGLWRLSLCTSQTNKCSENCCHCCLNNRTRSQIQGPWVTFNGFVKILKPVGTKAAGLWVNDLLGWLMKEAQGGSLGVGAGAGGQLHGL